MTEYKITKAEVARLALEWQKAKHVVVMIDDVSIQFATDVANKVLQDFVTSIAEIQAAKKAATGQPVPPPQIKPSLLLTDL
jgi:hypothetical protein